ncbi:hypothetical protein WYO_0204 [Methylobacterium sp. GXF4]|uniref:hypothetical protein n=1 Tax=Methylobacterium sp. GXF4 TaxID=1096546 RepID=UPI0002698F64|nr:hypothetical protein [Methylobacterium sp. GXF4]EIZ87167.1 hypothetical protein WYO_0204 [Methylobacterium sp. GXF4]
MRKSLFLVPLLLATNALAFDATKAPRYPSPDMYRPNVDSIILKGDVSSGNVSGMSVAPSDGRGVGTLDKLIGQTAIRFYPENFGANVGKGGDDYGAINAAINAAKPARGNVVLRGTYRTSACIKIDANVTVTFEGAKLNGTADTCALAVGQYGRLDGWGDIAVGGSSAFTHGAIEIDGADAISDLQITGSIRLANVSGQRTGDGLRMSAQTSFANRINYARISLGEIKNFNTGARLSATGQAFVNSNYIYVGSIFDCVQGVVTEVDAATAGVAFNFFEGSIQPEASATRALVLGGQGNQVNMMIWDWQTTSSPGTAITFSSGSRNNRVRSPIGMDLVEDRSGAFKIEANVVEDWSSASPSMRSTMPWSLRWQAFAGSQDDMLAFADKRYTVTQTAGSPPVDGALSSVFDLDGSNNATWNASSTYPVSIEVNFNAAPPTYLLGLGASFDFAGIPSNVALETFDGTTWTTRRSFANNGRAQVSWQPTNFAVNVKKVRLTFSGPPSAGSIYLSRFFGFGTVKDGGGAYRPVFSDAPLIFRDGGQPVPAPIPGYVQIYRDPSTYKFMLMEGNGTLHALAFQ